MMKKIKENEFYSIDTNEVELTYKYKKFMRGQTFRDSVNDLFGCVVSRRPEEVIIDGAKMKIIAPEDQLWIVNQWVKDTIHIPDCKLIIIDPVDFFGKRSISNIVGKLTEMYPELMIEVRASEQAGE